MNQRPPSESRPTDLKGRRILLVGGLVRQVALLRELVHARNGRFAHHDGGVEDGMRRLDSLFQGSDTVVFPVNCISHAAQDRIKRLCRENATPFVPLRGMGVGAFLQVLERVPR